MFRSSTVKWVFAALVLLSVGLKVGAITARTGQPRETAADITAFLSAQGFTVSLGSEASGLSFLAATRDDCRLLVADADPRGWHRYVIRQAAAPDDRVLFVYLGGIYSDQPTWLTWADYNWRKVNHLAGRELPKRIVLGMIASAGCDLTGTQWLGIAELT